MSPISASVTLVIEIANTLTTCSMGQGIEKKPETRSTPHPWFVILVYGLAKLSLISFFIGY
ncbi:hypothetical protein TUMSATVNIG3_00120 [Vibrio nigripulchritudo]|nr:hypothetical protein TUMSATVNIG2_00120 [Vibrio nigripulchritudo]BDU41214.1 hypothetical protein TUMSATVNIG3_00120 [Vibrio nigripulchritudo]